MDEKRIEFEKKVVDGNVAVLVSPGYGAGWATWAGSEHEQFAMFDSGLVELAERRADIPEVEAYLAAKLGEDAHFYVGGWRDICVEWIPAGTIFTIHEYDGSECIQLIEDLAFTA